MSDLEREGTLPHSSITPEDITPGTLLGICTSLKPPLHNRGRSAARSLLSYTLSAISDAYPRVAFLDLRDHPPPFFDGRMPEKYDNPSLNLIFACIKNADALLLSIPAYWAGVSGVFKNFVDTLCGPVYDMQPPIQTVFSNKPVGLLLVGADEVSAHCGAEQAQRIMTMVGAELVGAPVIIGNPRLAKAADATLSTQLLSLGVELLRKTAKTNACAR
jgi:NAD(P)H-dependent FMN reductase